MSISETASSITDEVRQHVVEQFAAGWKEPGPHAWDELLADGVDLRQPLMPHGSGRDHWQHEFGRLQSFLPDIRGEVLDWAGSGNTIYVEVRCRATVGGEPLQFRAVDRLTISNDSKVTARTSFLDPLPLLLTLAARPSAWLRWWRSGMAPLVGRRALTAGRLPATTPQNPPRKPDGAMSQAAAARGLGLIRTGVGLTALISPRTAYRSLNPRSNAAPVGGFMARAFGIREIAIASLTLSQDPDKARLGLQLGLLIDTIDAATVLRGRREIAPVGRLLIGLPAAVFAIIGAAALTDRGAQEGAVHDLPAASGAGAARR